MAPLKNDTERVPLPVVRPTKQQQEAALARVRAAECAKQNTFSCNWPKLSDSLKKLFSGPTPAKTPKRG